MATAPVLAHHGPASPQDRWEENAGTNGFTIATIIAALVASRRWLRPADAEYAGALADYWNERIEDWLYVEEGDLCQGRDIAGYYVRLGSTLDEPVTCGRVDVRNRNGEQVHADRLVALDFLALVRYGLRAADDQRIVDTVTLIDEILAVELPTGVAYLRYNGDGYGEQADGSPFEGSGIGRPWPLLSGERGHYEAQSGGDPKRYLDSMQAMAGPGGLFRAGMGRRGTAGAVPRAGSADGLGDAARVGARRVRETRHLRRSGSADGAARRGRTALRRRCTRERMVLAGRRAVLDDPGRTAARRRPHA